MIHFKNRWGLVSEEKWFADEITFNQSSVDLIQYRQAINRTDCNVWENFNSLTINLQDDLEKIFDRFKKDCRTSIRKALKDKLLYTCYQNPNENIINEFVSFYSEFARSKKISSIDLNSFKHYSEQGVLLLSKVSQEIAGKEKTLIWHSYLKLGKYIRLYQSASLRLDGEHSAISGRANRLHHWMDIQKAKELNFLFFDFGGWYDGDSDFEKIRINKFKEEFGGSRTLYFNGLVCTSRKGMIFLFIKKLLKLWQ